MSKLASLLQPHLPESLTIPDELERAWAWMEAQGWPIENDNGFFLPAVAQDKPAGIVFEGQLTLQGWFEPEEHGFDQVLPIAMIDGSGSLAALWNDNGTVRVGALGSDGETFLLAQSPLEFLQLVAVGYDEITHATFLDEPPYVDEDDDEDMVREIVAAHGPFRDWVSSEFGVDVPDHGSSSDPDPFHAWVCQAKGWEPEPERTFPARPAHPIIEIDAQAVLEVAERLSSEPVFDQLQRRTVVDVEVGGLKVQVLKQGQGIQLLDADSAKLRTEHDEFDAPPPKVAGLLAAATARWGEPQVHVFDSKMKSWLDERLRHHPPRQAPYWTVGEHTVALVAQNDDELILDVMPHSSRTEPAWP